MSYSPIETGKRIRLHRERLGISRMDFSERLNITQDHLQRVETGIKGASIDLLVDISDIYGVSLDYLLKGSITSQDEHMRVELENVVAQLTGVIESLKSD